MLEDVIIRVAEMLREGLELDMPYTAIESALDYIEACDYDKRTKVQKGIRKD